jgi:hypothetical protein
MVGVGLLLTLWSGYLDKREAHHSRGEVKPAASEA